MLARLRSRFVPRESIQASAWQRVPASANLANSVEISWFFFHISTKTSCQVVPNSTGQILSNVSWKMLKYVERKLLKSIEIEIMTFKIRWKYLKFKSLKFYIRSKIWWSIEYCNIFQWKPTAKFNFSRPIERNGLWNSPRVHWTMGTIHRRLKQKLNVWLCIIIDLSMRCLMF